ncbi:MAG: hypothetical protein PVH99_15070 [Desulfobacteraceae bacterium]|jgi:hypothetical protein
MKSLSRLLFAFVLIWGWLVPTSGKAGEWINQGEERFKFIGGVFLPAIDTEVRVDNTSLGIGDKINLQDDLGFDDKQTTFYGNAYWRFFSRHRIGVGYFRFKDEVTATAQRDLQIGDEIYPAGASISSEFKFEIFPIHYSYSFIKREKMEFSGTLGLHWYRISFGVGGSASLAGLDAGADVEAEANAPLPLLGLQFQYHFTPKWTASILAEAFALSYGDFDGSLVNLAARTEYWFFNYLGVGLALNWFRLDVEVDSGDWRGELEYKYWGPQIYITARF